MIDCITLALLHLLLLTLIYNHLFDYYHILTYNYIFDYIHILCNYLFACDYTQEANNDKTITNESDASNNIHGSNVVEYKLTEIENEQTFLQVLHQHLLQSKYTTIKRTIIVGYCITIVGYLFILLLLCSISHCCNCFF